MIENWPKLVLIADFEWYDSVAQFKLWKMSQDGVSVMSVWNVLSIKYYFGV